EFSRTRRNHAITVCVCVNRYISGYVWVGMRSPLHIMIDLTPGTAFWRGVIEGVARLCRENDHVRLRMPSVEWELIGNPGAVDGVISVIRDDATAHSAMRFGKPVVNVSSIREHVPFPTVAIDNRAVGRLAAEHLLGQGYRSF